MVSLLFGPLITDARGSIKGTTFSHAKSGSTARGRPRPPFPTRSLQQELQLALRVCSSAWPMVTTTYKGYWTTYAASVTLYNRLNQAFTPTGQMMALRTFMASKIFGAVFSPPIYQSAATLAAIYPPTIGGLPSAPVPVLALSGNDLRIASWTSPPPSLAPSSVQPICLRRRPRPRVDSCSIGLLSFGARLSR